MTYRIKFKEVVAGAALYGIFIDYIQVNKVFNANPGLLEDLTKVGEWETCCREAFANAIGHWLGLEGNWPLGGDTDSYAQAYFSAFIVTAKARGLHLSPNFSETA